MTRSGKRTRHRPIRQASLMNQAEEPPQSVSGLLIRTPRRPVSGIPLAVLPSRPEERNKPFPFFSHDALFPGATGKRHRAERLERCGNIFPHEPGRRENGVTEPKPAAFFPGRRETRAKEKVDAEPNPTPTHTKVFGGEPFWRKALPLHVSTIPPPSTRPPVRPPDAPAPQGRGRAPASRSCARAGGRRFAGPATPPAPGLRRRRDKGSP